MAHLARRLAIAGASIAVCFAAAAADLFNNTNTGGVQNGASGQALLMTPTPVHVSQLVTYHWNNGRGAPPGKLTLKSASGQTYGPFQAKGTSGQNNAPNVNWIADVNLQLPAGTYQLIDSDPGTWSQNAQTRGVGFAIIRGEQVTAAAAPTPPVVGQAGRLPPSGAPNAKPLSTSPPVARAPSGAPATAQLKPDPPGTIDLFNNYNKDDVKNGVQNQPALITPITVHVTQVITYHWNGGKGAKPGSISIKSASGQTYGPFPAVGTTAWQKIPNTNWVAQMDVTLPIGTYHVVDSDPSTWASNAASHGVGFAVIRGTRQAGLSVPPAQPTGAVVTGGIGKPVILPPGTVKPSGGATGSGAVAGSAPNFHACMDNAGSIATFSPCQGAPGTQIAIRLKNAIPQQLVQAIYKPYSVALPSATAAQVMVALKGNATAAGSIYEADTPKSLCVGGTGKWDVFLLFKNGQSGGDIGQFTIDCSPGAKPGGGNVVASTNAPPAAPQPTAFKPCFHNTGAIADVSPCNAHPNDILTIKLVVKLKSPLASVTFKPYQVYGGLPGATPVQVIEKLAAGGPTAIGGTYNFAAPQKLCVAGNASWDVWPVDAANKGQGDIGRVNVICH